MSKNTVSLFAFVIISAVVLSACQPSQPSNSSEASATPMTESTSPEASAQTTSETITVADSKEVSVVTNYKTPAGSDDVGFTLVLDPAGVITDVKTQVLAKAPISITRQEAFAKDAPTALKGKKLSELTNVDRIGGSSLTTNALNAALNELRSK